MLAESRRMVRSNWNLPIRMLHFLYSYLQYSSLCAKFLRRALKPEFREAAILKKEDTTAKVFQWKEKKPGPAGMY